MDIDYSSPVDKKDKLYKDLGGVSAFYSNAGLCRALYSNGGLLVVPVRFSAVYSNAGLLEAHVLSLAGWYEFLNTKYRFSIVSL